MFIGTIVLVFAVEVLAYRYISRKLEERRIVRRRLHSLVTEMPPARIKPVFGINRPGEN